MKKLLLSLIKKDGIFKQKVVLSSGQTSDYYVDLRRISLQSHGLYLISHLVWDLIKNDSITAIGGPTLGADPIIGGVCMVAHSQGKKLKGFIVRKTPKKHGRQNLIEGKPLTPKDRVVLIDDVATTGGSLVNAIGILRNHHIPISKVITVLDRGQGAKEEFKKLKCPFVSIFSKKDIL